MQGPSRKLWLTEEESESRDGSWSLTACRMVSQGEPSEGVRSLDAMVAQAYGLLQRALILGALWSTGQGVWQAESR